MVRTRTTALVWWACACVAMVASLARAQSKAEWELKPVDSMERGLVLPGRAEPIPVGVTPWGRAASLGPIVLEQALDPAPAQPPLLMFEDVDGTSNAPPTNDNCSSATVINGLNSWAFDNSKATLDGRSHFACNFFGSSQIDSDVWFRWRAPNTARFVIDTCTGTTIDSKLAVYALGACPPTDSFLLGCSDDSCSVQSRVVINATQNQQYLIRVGVFPGNPGGPGTLRIQFDAGQNFCALPDANCQTRNNTDAFEASGAAVIDDFTPTATGFISSICFYGTYFNGSSNCQGVFPDDFIITYYDNVGGQPSSVPYRTFQPGEYTLVGPVWTGNLINGTFPEYSYTLTHPGLQVFSGFCYWIEIRNRLPAPPNGNCSWYWQKGNGGNSIAFQGGVRISEDMAFCLNIPRSAGSPCPQPVPPANDECSSATSISCSSTRFDQDTLFATTSPTDPPFPCRFGGEAQGVGTLWYRFTPSNTSARITLCGNDTGDTLLALYRGNSCGSLTLVACSEDFCGFRSQICVSGLQTGQTHYIQLATHDEASRGPYDISITCPCPNPPANDLCTGATLVNVPGTVFGDTRNATLDSNSPVCGFSLVSAPSVWYRVVGDGNRFRATTCRGGTTFDTKLSIYCGTCTQPICVADNDDDPMCGTASTVEWCTEAGRTYYILVNGFAGDTGPFELGLSNLGTSCTPTIACTTCDLMCPVGATPEGEPCGEDLNGGCNSTPAAFQPITCGQTICGIANTVGTRRDTDWYEFTLNTPSIVTWTVHSEVPIDAFVLDDSCPPTTLLSGTTERCGTATATGVLQPGTYRAFVGATGDGYPCGLSNEYIAGLNCVPIGACCTTNDCTRVGPTQCTAIGGTYGGDGSVCPIDYSASTCTSVLESIANTGSPIVLAGDGGAQVPIGFAFRFYGIEYSSVGVSANGYLSFDPQLGETGNRPFPNVDAPNAIIAPFWDDLSPDVGGTMRFQTLGVAPTRRFIVQWTNVPQFLTVDANTFQVVLFESNQCIEFRYGMITPQATPGDYSIGVENQSGAKGTNINPATISAGSCIRLCPVLASGGCLAVAPCPGDADGDRVVGFPDVTSILRFWGGAGPLGDADDDGFVGFPDVTQVLRNWGNVCG